MGCCLFALLLSACHQQPQWVLFYYPDATQAPATLETQAIAGYYQNLDHCQRKGAGLIKLAGTDNGVFVCGLDCQQTANGLHCEQRH
ncbi:hypothetical protein KU855_08265 [Shewanella sp. NIFS-20-20]|nr:hypothetical protein [Shewanella sp. NIFS-20-20]